MIKPAIFLLVALTAASAADSWTRVMELKTGAELRIFKKGSMQPVMAQFGDATEENLIVVIKNDQSAIPKDQIERIDARPEQKSSRVKQETKATTNDPRPNVNNPKGNAGPNSSYSSGLVIGSKPDFEMVYRRQSPPPKQ